jgi:translation elongation factor EF-G
MPAHDLIHIHVLVPDPMTGEVLGKLNRMGGLVTGVIAPKPNWTGIEETLPRAHLPEFKAWLQEYSQGQGEVSER